MHACIDVQRSCIGPNIPISGYISKMILSNLKYRSLIYIADKFFRALSMLLPSEEVKLNPSMAFDSQMPFNE